MLGMLNGLLAVGFTYLVMGLDVSNFEFFVVYTLFWIAFNTSNIASDVIKRED